MATNKRDYYEVLGVSKEATEDELKKAYRKLAKENHPDLHPGDKACEERFKEINEAYEILSDPEKKQLYDQYGHAAFDPNAGPYGPGGFGDLGDFFGDIFGGFGFGDIFGGGGARRSNGPRKGESIRTNISISFEEAAFGCKKDISVARVETCADCSGSGAKPGTQPETCPNCKGTGAVRTTQRTPLGMVQSSAPCQQCHGTGKIVKDPCNTCHGMGKIRKQHKINVTIPAGIDDGQTVSLRGQGNAGSNGGPAGDLLVYVIVRPDARFEREGSDVLLEQEISYAQAALGGEIQIPTIDGKVKLNIPEGTQTGSVFRLKGKGIQYLRGSGRGDQYVTVRVVVPKHLTSEQKELLRKFSASVGETPAKENGHSSIFGKKKR
jgi:molecular chaperone DnaJ